MSGQFNSGRAGCVLAAILAFGAGSVRALDNSDCMSCHDDRALTKPDGKGGTVSLWVDEAAFKASIHGSNACTSCHADVTEAPHPDGFAAKPATCLPCHERSAATYAASAHGIARRAGNLKAPGCGDCHGSHAIIRSGLPASPLNHANLASTCGRCHAVIVRDVRESVHGKAMAEGVSEAPTCTDCHFEHAMEELRTATPMKIAEEVCSRCHASERLNTKFSLPSDRVKTFFESYHGLAARLGSTRAANCASCHGFHNILPSSDPRSTVYKGNLRRTCQKCHPGATEKFSAGKVHLDDTLGADIGSRVNLWVRRIYLAVIFGVIGVLAGHNVLLFRKKLMVSYRDAERTFVRMNLVQRIQHLALMLSFIYLSITGFALKYPGSWAAYLVGSSEQVRRMGHRVAAVVMLALALAHVVYVLATKDGRRLIRALLPAGSDARDVATNARHLLSRRAPKARFGRFGYPEKMEYWAVAWGVAVMGGTGLVIWGKLWITQWVPRWVVDVAVTVHLYEAILAILAIIVWHFYLVIFDPDVYPLNWAWWDGRVRAHWYRDEHPLDPDGPDEDSAAAESGAGENGPDASASATGPIAAEPQREP